MNTQTLRNKKVRKELLKGIDHVVNTVKKTVGPKGRNVILEREYNTPEITNDAYNIIKEINLKDRYKNLAVNVLKDISQRTNDEAGDGRTTAAILTQSMFRNGLKYIESPFRKINPIELKKGMTIATDSVIDSLKKQSKEAKDKKSIYNIAHISSESEKIAEVVTELVMKVGKDGVINVSESGKSEIEYEMSQGMELPNGFVSPHMAFNKEKMETEFTNPRIMITDRALNNVMDIVPVIKELGEKGISHMILIADDIGDVALQTILVNNQNGPFKIIVIKAPGFADERGEWLEDIAATVGANVVSQKTATPYSIENLGGAKKVIIKKNKTIIIGGEGDTLLRSAQIQTELDKERSDYGKKKLKERLGRMNEGIGIIKVGAPTETETKYLKRKVDDTVNAVQAAMQEGYVPGGGVALAHTSKKLKELNKGFSGSVRVGINIVEEAIKEPLIQISNNAGRNGNKVLNQVLKYGGGYDAKRDVFTRDMVKDGIIDSVKVLRSALKNATSGAGHLLTTGSAIVLDDEPNNKN